MVSKSDLVNDILNDMRDSIDRDTENRLKIVLTVRLSNLDLVESRQLPSTDVKDNDWIIKRFQVDHAAKGVKKSSIDQYVYAIRKFFDTTHLCYADVTGQAITDYLAIKQYTKNSKGGLYANRR